MRKVEETVKIASHTGWNVHESAGKWFLCLALALTGFFSPRPACANIPLTDIAAARQKNVTTPLPVRLRGVVTGFSGWKNSFFLQDSTGAISVDRLDHATVDLGEKIEVTGELRAGLFAPIVLSRQIQSVKYAISLTAPEMTYAQLTGGRFDSQVVKVSGVIRSVHIAEKWGKQVLVVDLQTSGGLISVHVLHYPPGNFNHLVDSTVSIKGICGTIFNNRRELVGIRLFTYGLDQIEVVEPGLSAASLPVSPLASLGKFDGPPAEHRVKIAGTVTYQASKSEFYLQQGDSAIRIQTAAPGAWPIGLHVNVAGFLANSGGFLRSLREAQVEPLGIQAPPKPVAISAADIVNTNNGFVQTPYVGRLIQLKGRIIELLPSAATQLWVVRSGNFEFQAQLANSTRRKGVVLEADNDVTLTGICLVDEDEDHNPLSFRILLRSSDDIATLNAPYWSSSLVLLLTVLSLIFVGSLITWFFNRHTGEPLQNDLSDRETRVLRCRFCLASRILAGFSIACSLVVVVGWTADLLWLQVRDSQTPMMPNSALAVLAAAIAIWFVNSNRRSISIAGYLGAAVTAVIGSLTLAEYITPLRFGFDLFLVRNIERFQGSVDPGRMVLASALCLLLTGCGIAATVYRRHAGIGQVLSIAVGVIGLLNLIDRLYGDESKYGTGAHAVMAIPTALALLILSLANLFARPECGLMSTVSLSGSGGMMARRVFPVALIAPVALGWIRLQGQMAGLYGTRFGLALFALSNVVCFGFVVWSSAAVLNRLDRAKSTAEKNLNERDRRLEMVFQTASVGDWSWDAIHDEVIAHPVVWKLYGDPDHLDSEPLDWFQKRQHPDDSEMVSRKQREAIDSETRFDIEFRVVHPNGEVRWICSRGKPVTGLDGQLLRLDGICFDVTEQKNAETQLQLSEERFRQLADAMPQIVWTAAPDGQILYFNKRWYEYTGVNLNASWLEVLHPDDSETCQQIWMQSIAEGSAYELELRLRRSSNSTYRWHLSRAIPVRNAAGIIEQWFGTSTDIHDFKQASEEVQALNQTLEKRVQERSAQLADTERRYRLLVEGVQDYAIYVLDTDGTVATWSLGAERLSGGYESSEVLGRHFSMFYTPEESATKLPEAQLELAIAQGQTRTEGWRRRKDGSSFWASLLITAMQEGGQNRGFSIIIRDLTEQKRAQDLIISEGKRAEEANRAKSSFLAAMSHEIRTPMNAILGMADLLWETDLDLTQRDYVSRFRRAGTNLLTLINDILDLSKIESGRFELESVDFDLEDLVDRTVELMGPRARVKGIELTSLMAAGTPRYLIGDPSRLQQVLNNLIGNAVKFTEKGSVVLTVSPHSGGAAGHLQISVKDTGIGIPADKNKAIFNDFMQAESSTTRRFGGTGLGLGICRRLVDRMGGALSVESTFGQGSTFFFDIVLALSDRVVEAEDNEIIDFTGCRVLVVDDHSANRLIVNQMCSGWGMETAEAESAKGAREMITQALDSAHPFSLVLLDKLLPEAEGFETLRSLLKLDPNLPIILLSSDHCPGDTTTAKSIGAAGYMMKPVRGAELLALISKVLRERRSHLRTAPSSDSGASASKLLRILVAEDSEDNRFLLSAYLKNRPYQVTFAFNGQEAVSRFENEAFDLIFMDIQMPVMDGLTAAARIRDLEQKSAAKPTPIVALTANALVEDVEQSRAAGCNAHLSKPISKDKLIAAIESFRNVAPAKPEKDAPSPSQAKPDYKIKIPSGFEQLSRNYIAARQKDLERFLAFGKGQGLDELLRFGHNMKGTGISFGFPELTNLGAAIEASAKASKSEEIARHLAQLSEYVEYASKALA